MDIEQSIIERLEKLEKQNRRMKRVGGVFLAIVASLLLMGQAAAKHTFDGTEFLLRDSKGVIRAKWTVTDKGPQLLFLDTNGDSRINLQASDSPLIRLDDKNGNFFLAGPPSIMIKNSEGFAHVGAASITDERKSQTIIRNEFSILAKDGLVLWEAPIQR